MHLDVPTLMAMESFVYACAGVVTLPERCCASCEARGASFAREGWQNSRHSFALQ
jgi:hypothetical protein